MMIRAFTSRFSAGFVLLPATLFLGAMLGCDPPPEAAKDSAATQEQNESTAGDAAGQGGEGGEAGGEAETRVEAQVGVGKRGENSRRNVEKGGVAKMIAAPAASLFNAKEKIIFTVAIPKNMELYKAMHGEYPRSHDDFMQHIIRAGQIQLPELPAGQRYEYDAESAKLMVVKPAS